MEVVLLSYLTKEFIHIQVKEEAGQIGKFIINDYC